MPLKWSQHSINPLSGNNPHVEWSRGKSFCGAMPGMYRLWNARNGRKQWPLFKKKSYSTRISAGLTGLVQPIYLIVWQNSSIWFVVMHYRLGMASSARIHRGRSLLKNCARISRSIIRSLIHRLAEMFDDHFWIAILIKPFAKLEVRHFVVIYDDHYETPPHTVLLTRKRLHSWKGILFFICTKLMLSISSFKSEEILMKTTVWISLSSSPSGIGARWQPIQVFPSGNARPHSRDGTRSVWQWPSFWCLSSTSQCLCPFRCMHLMPGGGKPCYPSMAFSWCCAGLRPESLDWSQWYESTSVPV